MKRIGNFAVKWMLVCIMMSAVLLGGCGSRDQTEGGAEDSQAAPIQTAAGETAAPGPESSEPLTRLYRDESGEEVEIPAAPKRVITINMTAELVALGIKPVGAADNWLKPLSDEEKSGIESLGAVGSINLEKMVALEPDLIIAPVQVTTEEQLEAYRKIAPTVMSPFFGDPLENLRTAGRLMGLEEQAEARIEAYEAKAQETKAALSSVVKEGQTGLVIQFYQKTMYVYPPSTFPTVHQALGLQPPVDSLNELTKGLELSQEVLPEYAADHIFIIQSDSVDGQFVNEVMNSSVWKGLPAVASNQVYQMGNRLSTADILTLEWALDEAVRLMKP